jgi:hypothetical protein
MLTDNLTICSRCGSDACYEHKAGSEYTIHMCYGCGFTTNTLMKTDSEFLEEQIEVLPELYKDLIYVDGEGKNWMPSTINIHDRGMVFINGKTTETWKWAAVKAIEIPEDKKEEFHKIDENVTHKMDMSTLKEFDEKDFMEALSYIGLLP